MIAFALAVALAAAAEPPNVGIAEVTACLGADSNRPGNWLPMRPHVLAERRAALSEAEWQDICRQAREADARRRSVIETIVREGRSPVGGFETAASLARAAHEAKDPVVAELFRRSARDQADRARSELSRFAAGLAPLAREFVVALHTVSGVKADQDNTAWLKRTVAQRGWFTASRDGKAAGHAAWIIVQHADQDPAFQQEIVSMMEPLVAAGEVSKSEYAYLYDRVARKTGRPQRYGTQGRCTGPGQWEPNPIEEPESVDARRREAGIPMTLAEYKAGFRTICQ